MTQPIDQHLDLDELSKLASLLAARNGGREELSKRVGEEALRHYESCMECGRKVQMQMAIERALAGLSRSGAVPQGPECSTEADWLSIVARLAPSERIEERMKHAAQCDHCGPLLKEASAFLADEATPEEEKVLASLESRKPEWQRNLIAELQGDRPDSVAIRSTAWWKELLRWPRSPFAVAAVATMVIAGWLGWRWLHPASAEQLLAQAYTEHRTLEVRFPGAIYAPLRVERGMSGSSMDKPGSLLRAEELIGENLAHHPNDPDWLDAKSRADLLDGNYDAAIQSLQRALEAKPDSPQLLTDLGSAFFLRASSSDHAVDYGNAVELLSKALARSPDDPIALFNRALACERMFLYTQAVDDWEHYLRIDPRGEWSDEARKRLAGVKGKLVQRQKSLAEPLLTPEQMAKSGLDDSTLRDRLDERIEQYMKLAVTDWLPVAPSPPGSDQYRESQRALSMLAELARDRHNDFWLSDLLRQTEGVGILDALKSLASAVQADDRGDYSAGRTLARDAAEKFQGHSNEPGLLRAQAEEVYADDLLWEGEHCVSLLRSIVPPIKANRYSWLEAHLSLEESNCANRSGYLGRYRSAIEDGLREAEANHYPGELMRGLGFKAEAAASLGDADAAMSLVEQGLKRFWSGQDSRMLGYNLYTDLDSAADDLRLPNLQVVLWREATALIDPHPDVLQRAMAHTWYGYAAYLARVQELAALEFSRASSLLATAPQTVATIRDRMDAEIWLAGIETRQGDLNHAASHLKEVKTTLETTPSFGPEIGYYTAQSEIALRQSKPDLAEAALRPAILLAEWALKSFPSEGDRGKWAEQIHDAYRNAVEWKLRSGDGDGALELWEWYRGAELRYAEHSARHPSEDIDSATLPNVSDAPPLPSLNVVANRRAHLQDQTAVVVATFSDGIAIWLYDDRGVVTEWVATPLARLNDMVARFERLCSDPQSDPVMLRIAGRSLYDLLLAPVQNRLIPGRTLLIEADDDLASLPWEALVDGSNHYLVERASVVVTPGLYRQMQLRPSTGISSRSPALVVSVPASAAEGLAPLPDAEEEARDVAGRFADARWLQNADASLGAIQREIHTAVVFHFAGHALASAQRSGLVLAEVDPATRRSQLINAASLSKGQTGRLQLAVLSACSTGSEDHSPGSGTESVATALLRSGVPHVVATRWNIDSSQTANFMSHFYAHLLSGHDAASSLHTAQLAFASQSTTSHPYYWSAFVLQGKP